MIPLGLPTVFSYVNNLDASVSQRLLNYIIVGFFVHQPLCSSEEHNSLCTKIFEKGFGLNCIKTLYIQKSFHAVSKIFERNVKDAQNYCIIFVMFSDFSQNGM